MEKCFTITHKCLLCVVTWKLVFGMVRAECGNGVSVVDRMHHSKKLVA
jgi:hypothetical protein